MIYPHLYGPSFAGQKIGLLGGSFNPAHGGHRAMSLYALNRLGLDAVWWVVSPQNPLKSPRDMAPFEKRILQAKKIARHPKIIVTDIEAQLNTRYTVDTLRKLSRQFPKTRFVWLMGSDNMQQIPRWRRWPEIFGLAPVAVFRRPGYGVGRGRGLAANRFNSSWHSMRYAKQLADMEAPAWLVLDNPLNMLSATEIRRQQSR